MAGLSITHQLGSLAGSPIQSSSDSGLDASTSSAVVNAAAVWKSPQTNLRCRIQGGGTEIEALSPPVSPCRSPVLNGIRADLTVACQAFTTTDREIEMMMPQLEEEMMKMRKFKEGVNMNNGVNRKKAMNASLSALKSAGVEGIMMDVWWGLVERDGPGVYNWGGYIELMEMAKKHGLKVQAVMSFHQCGGNVGDSCTIPLPRWVTEEVDQDPDLAYTDQWGRRNYEYISLGCDTLPVLKGRTPIQCYGDFMRAFRDQFKHFLGETIVISVLPEQNGTWRFPGIGAFQCYDKYMISSLQAAANAAGKSEWGSTGPRDAGEYNNWPEDTPFFRREGGGWDSQYGEFFLTWYSQMLLDHGERIVSSAKSIFETTGVKISVKVAGIHWHYGTRSHAPELTAGYYNTRFHDGYRLIAQMLARHGAVFNFTCIEMRDHEQPQDAQCAPEKLVKQVALATREFGVPLAGENALPRYDETAHDQILNAASLKLDDSENESEMCAFTYLRMNPFVSFVKKMKEGKDANRCLEQVEREAEHFVHVTQPLVQEAAVALMH
ncbi:hypothetical protein MKW92_047676 [Papaver armeniacum]|nr:hypothetical protein MKW92_047676 [Papaver armeniacum]